MPAGVAGRPAHRQQALVLRMESVDVLGRRDRRLEVEDVDGRLRGERALHDHAVHVGPCVEVVDDRQRLLRPRIRGKHAIERPHASLVGGPVLHSHVHGRGRILTDQHVDEPGDDSSPRKGSHPLGHFRPNLGRDGLPVDDPRRHLLSLEALGARELSDGNGGGR
jgi:hypothetical protein